MQLTIYYKLEFVDEHNSIEYLLGGRGSRAVDIQALESAVKCHQRVRGRQTGSYILSGSRNSGKSYKEIWEKRVLATGRN